MKWLDAKWSQIKQVQSIPIVKSMYVWLFVVPILVKSLYEIESKLNLQIFEQSFIIDTQLPFSFWFFYFSALCFVLSNVLYKLRCPHLVQEHDSWRSFAEHGKGADHLDEYVHQLRSNITKDDYDRAWEISSSGAPGGKLQDQFWEFYRIGEKQSPRSRKLAHFLNILAFMLMAVVILQNLYTVVLYACRSLYAA